MLPSEICLTVEGLRVRPSAVSGVWASRAWVEEEDDGDVVYGEVSYFAMACPGGVRKGSEKPTAIKRGRARVTNLNGVGPASRGRG
jgi:hypothetical protein